MKDFNAAALILNDLLKYVLFFKWFDLTCGPKIAPDADPAPVVIWEDGQAYKFNVYPLCGALKQDLHLD